MCPSCAYDELVMKRSSLFARWHVPQGGHDDYNSCQIRIRRQTNTAKVKLNPVLEQMRGPVGDLVFKRYLDAVIVGSKPDRSGVQPTEVQLQHLARFRQAVLYRQLMMADPEKKALYAEAANYLG